MRRKLHNMTTTPPVLEPAFLAGQRARLLALRTDLARAEARDAGEERQVAAAAQGHADETEDRAQDLTLSDSDRILAGQLGRQRVAIERALAKLDDGTYGFSDVSGLPIPVARLQALPQATRTISEESESPADEQRSLP